ncbi:hypothetical protein HYU12_02950 [Candidatus Woesearchaeota archaeon]|nr:hypothetical protein [Candidatus Woesearchaeota archaeon]
MDDDERLRKLEGLHTAETAARVSGLTRQSTLNLLSRLKKEGYVTVSGGGKQPRLYKITMRKQRPRSPGMFDIINKYSPMKLAPWYDHQVHGKYGPEEALVDAIQTQSFRVILASMRLYKAPYTAKKQFLIKNYQTKEPEFFPVEEKWKVAIPFRRGDLERMITG